MLVALMFNGNKLQASFGEASVLCLHHSHKLTGKA